MGATLTQPLDDVAALVLESAAHVKAAEAAVAAEATDRRVQLQALYVGAGPKPNAHVRDLRGWHGAAVHVPRTGISKP